MPVTWNRAPNTKPPERPANGYLDDGADPA